MTRSKNWVSIPIKDPQPKKEPSDILVTRWPIERSIILGAPAQPQKQDFATVLEQRRSCRTMGNLSLKEIIRVLGFALSPRFEKSDDPNGRYQSPTISAGALHSVEVILVSWRGAKRIFRYNRSVSRLESLLIANPRSISNFIEHFYEVLPLKADTALALLGDIQRISQFYENPESLLYRDAGAVLQSISLSAAAHNVGFCPLGILGGELLEGLRMPSNAVLPLGVAAIGTREI